VGLVWFATPVYYKSHDLSLPTILFAKKESIYLDFERERDTASRLSKEQATFVGEEEEQGKTSLSFKINDKATLC
jgi:hypothetical protein